MHGIFPARRDVEPLCSHGGEKPPSDTDRLPPSAGLDFHSHPCQYRQGHKNSASRTSRPNSTRLMPGPHNRLLDRYISHQVWDLFGPNFGG
jgi:hypothetical protein